MNLTESSIRQNESLVVRKKRAQLEAAQTPFNRWVAGVNLGHDPSEREALWWFTEHDGAAEFARQHPEFAPENVSRQ